MSEHLQNLNTFIKEEADKILYEIGLISILNSFGIPHIHGSYLLDLMTWRDLDIYLEVDNISEADFFMLGSKICSALKPSKMSYRNELIAKTQGLPKGLYWGIYLGNEKAGAWKIDIWAVNNSECQRLMAYCKDIKQRLNPSMVSSILDIKSQCWNEPGYRRNYNSSDIYNAVIEKNITNLEEFKAYLNTKS